MKIMDIILLSAKNVVENRLRSILSTIGIIIGIAAVITIISIGQGGKMQIMSKLERIGANRFELFVGTDKGEDKDLFDARDISILKEYINEIQDISPLCPATGGVSQSGTTLRCDVYGVSDEYKEIENKYIKSGRFLLESDVDNSQNVAVLSDTLAKKLFKNDNIVGKNVFISVNGFEMPYLVIGVADDDLAGISSIFSGTQSSLYIPYTTLLRSGEISGIPELSIKLNDHSRVKEVMSQATDIMERRHNNNGIYKTYDAQKDINTVDSVISIFTAVMILVAAISLIVGGIGIMNIMLVSVSERTKEIGVAKAIGATNFDIMIQFLFECIFITMVGGMIGMILGIIFSYIISILQKWPFIVQKNYILVALLFSIGVGIISGLYPAYKAANKNPIDSLKSE